ncbi:hypothetical protein [Haloechinothrix salitolerans]|uniref:Uncharacterized protein n=1 Tax=Haloechinothrix salitolerans TaxID=926830 RepID=A0ABW2C2M8_9PSEU
MSPYADQFVLIAEVDYRSNRYRDEAKRARQRRILSAARRSMSACRGRARKSR